MVQVVWDQVLEEGEQEPYGDLYRARVLGGWLAKIEGESAHGITFIPDPNHEWK